MTWDDYYIYLVDMVCPAQGLKTRYSKLLRMMFEENYHWVVRNDSNRAEDGLFLRFSWCDESGLEAADLGPANYLEVLVAFSKRIELDIMGDPRDENTDFGRWFWLMLSNSGLDEFDNRAFIFEKVMNILENPDFFPLKRKVRHLELWSKMCYFFEENG